MSLVSKIDGFAGTNELRKRFVDLYATTAVTKGQLVALDMTPTPTNGFGNHVKACDASVVLNSIPVGIAAEAIGAGEKGSIQVFGHCTFATCSNEAAAYDTGGDALNDADEGHLLTASTEAGSLRDYDTSAALAAGGDNLPVAILIEYGTADTADSTVFLLNPCKY